MSMRGTLKGFFEQQHVYNLQAEAKQIRRDYNLTPAQEAELDAILRQAEQTRQQNMMVRWLRDLYG